MRWSTYRFSDSARFLFWKLTFFHTSLSLSLSSDSRLFLTRVTAVSSLTPAPPPHLRSHTVLVVLLSVTPSVFAPCATCSCGLTYVAFFPCSVAPENRKFPTGNRSFCVCDSGLRFLLFAHFSNSARQNLVANTPIQSCSK